MQFGQTRLAIRAEDSVLATSAQITPGLAGGGLHLLVLANRYCILSYRPVGRNGFGVYAYLHSGLFRIL